MRFDLKGIGQITESRHLHHKLVCLFIQNYTLLLVIAFGIFFWVTAKPPQISSFHLTLQLQPNQIYLLNCAEPLPISSRCFHSFRGKKRFLFLWMLYATRLTSEVCGSFRRLFFFVCKICFINASQHKSWQREGILPSI